MSVLSSLRLLAALVVVACSAPGQAQTSPVQTEPTVATPTGAPVSAIGRGVAKDGAGDLLNGNDRAVSKPAYVDIRKVEVETSGSDLLLTMTLDGAPPAKRSSSIESIDFVFVLDTTDDGEWDYWVNLANREDGTYVGSLDDWVVTYHYDGPEFPGSVILVDDLVVGRVPLSMLGTPKTLAFCALTQNSDPMSGNVNAEDNAPDGSCLGGGPLVSLK